MQKVIGHPLDAKVVIAVPADEAVILRKLGDELKEVLIVSQVEVVPAPELDVTVGRAEGRKCERCWQYKTDVEATGPHPNICRRCADTLTSS